MVVEEVVDEALADAEADAAGESELVRTSCEMAMAGSCTCLHP